ncbi:hypothetical protein BDZ45DRAFT_790328 [Acephala macrosclerotiorum]|nr:hypothetical protein BDZ45DRAFT_790328 [Acephala macrosclerotiorum]
MSSQQGTQQTQKGAQDSAAQAIAAIFYDTTGQLLPPDFTSLGKKCSHPRGIFANADHRVLNKTGKSGLTPISSPPPEFSDDKLRAKKIRRLENYQKIRLHGYTAAELRDLNALEPLDLEDKHEDLKNPMHPVFDKSQWLTEDILSKHKAAQPILGAYEGFWATDDYDRLGLRVRFATTLVHELAHATWRAIRASRGAWGGRNRSAVLDGYARGGPGLPQMAVCKDNFFTSESASYKTSAGAPPQNKPVPSNELDPFYTYDFWAIPTSWSCNTFRENWWMGVRKYEKGFMHMGPLKYGYRTIDSLRGSGPKRNLSPKWDDPDPYGPPDGPSWENNTSIREGMARNPSRQANADSAPEDELDSGEVPAVRFSCPRWDEITQYLFENRAPGDLSLDTTTIISLPVLYRYIRNHGGIDLSPTELRNFLGVANERKELFIWEPHPDPGIVMKIEAGWPPALDQDIIDDEPSDLAQALDTYLSDEKTQEGLYESYGECRDLEIEEFLRWLKFKDSTEWDIPLDEFQDAIEESYDIGSAYIAKAPEGIVRFIFDIDDIREKFSDKFTNDRMRDLTARAQS